MSSDCFKIVEPPVPCRTVGDSESGYVTRMSRVRKLFVPRGRRLARGYNTYIRMGSDGRDAPFHFDPFLYFRQLPMNESVREKSDLVLTAA